VVRLCRGEGQTRADVFLLQIRKIAQHFGTVYTGGNKIEDILHPIRMPRMQGRPPHSFGLKVMRSMTWSLTLTAEGSKGSKRFPSPLCGSLTACRLRSRSIPIPSTLPRSSASWGRRGGDVTSLRGAPPCWEAC